MTDQSGIGVPGLCLAEPSVAGASVAFRTRSTAASATASCQARGSARTTCAGVPVCSCHRRATNRSQFRVAVSKGMKAGSMTTFSAPALLQAERASGTDGPPCSSKASATIQPALWERRYSAKADTSAAGWQLYRLPRPTSTTPVWGDGSWPPGTSFGLGSRMDLLLYRERFSIWPGDET